MFWPALGPCKTIGCMLCGQCWAHTTASLACWVARGWIVQDCRLHALGPVLGPCEFIGSILFGLHWAHARPSVACFVASAGPTQDHWQHAGWPGLAHARSSVACCGG